MPYKKKTFLQKNFMSLVTLALVLVVLLQRCEAPKPSEGVTIIRDTTWIVKDSLITSKPQVTKTIQIESHDTIINHYIPDTNYQKLVLQYQEVVNQLLAKNIYNDTLKIDTLGWVKVMDTVTKNLIANRTFKWHIKYPVIKETITIPAKKVNQVYIGGVIQGGAEINQIGASALLKTRNDFLFGGSLSVNTYGNLQYGVGAYWKIKLKK